MGSSSAIRWETISGDPPEATELVMEREGVTIPAKKKADLIVFIYENLRKDAQDLKGKRLESAMEQAVKKALKLVL